MDFALTPEHEAVREAIAAKYLEPRPASKPARKP